MSTNDSTSLSATSANNAIAMNINLSLTLCCYHGFKLPLLHNAVNNSYGCVQAANPATSQNARE